LINYLSYISQKYEVEAPKLFNNLIDARKNGTAKIGPLSIECRSQTPDHAIFMISSPTGFVAQLRVENEMLKTSRKNDFDMPENSLRRIRKLDADRNSGKDRLFKIKDLHSGMKGVKVKARVASKSAVQKVFSRYTYSLLHFVRATISDDTGSISLMLWNDQTDKINVGDTIAIENGYVKNFRGEKQLGIGKNGKILVEGLTPITSLTSA
jgi:replication factor A1